MSLLTGGWSISACMLPFISSRPRFRICAGSATGRIVLTTSGRALTVADCVPGLAAYNVGKMAQLGLIIAVAAELRDIDIEINAISPVAATRVLRRSAPELLPELVAPGVGFLASAACTVSGVVLRAAGGRFSAARWIGGEGIDLGAAPTGPEAIVARWQEIVEIAS
jgi:NAD(P)-dependent dehydrogenase (short-subunit alcohol dehydrogenase family)